MGHPQVGASWEGFVIEQILFVINPSQCYFWGTHSGAELDLFFIKNGRRVGIEVKFSEAPKTTKSTRIAMKELRLAELFVLYPGKHQYKVDHDITVCPLSNIFDLKNLISISPK